MKNNEAYKRIEAHDQYPSGFSSNVKTQRKLLEDSVRATEKKSVFYFTRARQIIAASALLILFTFIGYILLPSSKNQQIKITRSAINTREQVIYIQHSKQSFIVPKQNTKLPKVPFTDTVTNEVDSIILKSDAEVKFAFNADTIVPQKEKPSIAPPNFFAKRQRIKEFNFEARTIAPASKKQKNMEFFVLKDGQFKILSKNKIKEHIIQYE